MNSETKDSRGRKAWEPMQVSDVGDLVTKVGGGSKPVSSPLGDPGDPKKNTPAGG